MELILIRNAGWKVLFGQDTRLVSHELDTCIEIEEYWSSGSDFLHYCLFCSLAVAATNIIGVLDRSGFFQALVLLALISACAGLIFCIMLAYCIV